MVESSTAMSTAKFSTLVKCFDDLYEMAKRNDYYLPEKSSSSMNELSLLNIVQKIYWCPKVQDMRLKNCVKAPLKEVLLDKLRKICMAKGYNIAWIDETHTPDKKWLVDVLATVDPENEIFKKDYVAPPVRKRLRDIETIVLPNELFEGLPQSTSKVKARRLKIMSEAFAKEKTVRLREMQKDIAEEILE